MTISVPINAKEKLIKAYEDSYNDVLKDPQAGALIQFDLKRLEERKALMEKSLPVRIDCLKMLEIGSGAGVFVCYLRDLGVKAYGIEPDDLSYQASQLVLQENHFSADICYKGVGEDLPYEDASFDLIVSYNVLEHTQDPLEVLRESYRVLRSNGFLFFSVPNYFSWWEGHYAIPWIPWLSKQSAKYYVRLYGRNNQFIDSLQFIKPGQVEKWLEACGFELLSMGEDIFQKRLELEDVKEHWAVSRSFKALLKAIKLLRLNFVLSKVLVRFKMHYPLTIIARKP